MCGDGGACSSHVCGLVPQGAGVPEGAGAWE
jgi:hypothetical protein